MPVPISSSMRDALTDALAASMVGQIPTGTARRLHGAAQVEGKAAAVVGMRRAGKTTLVHQTRGWRLAEGAPRELVPYINFEDERLAGIEARHLGFLLEEFARRVPRARESGKVLWSFDEIQVVRGWERFVRRLLDLGGTEVTVTGSSSALLSREIGTAMRGRAWEVQLYPFGFAEALEHGGGGAPEAPDRLTADGRAKLEHEFLRWLEGGGFPEVQALDAASHRQTLRSYVDVAILRDVVERHSVSNVTGLRWLVRHLLGNAGGLFSIEKFHRALKGQGLAISRDTLHQLLAHLEDCFLVRPVWMEADSERQRMVNPRKVYPVDQGLIPIFDRTGRGNLGHSLETAVLVELQRRRCEVTYVRTAEGHEVDFLARTPEGAIHLIQVCADAADPDTANRELRALREAGRRWPKAKRWLLTLTQDSGPSEIPKGITVCPAYRWMLSVAE